MLSVVLRKISLDILALSIEKNLFLVVENRNKCEKIKQSERKMIFLCKIFMILIRTKKK